MAWWLDILLYPVYVLVVFLMFGAFFLIVGTLAVTAEALGNLIFGRILGWK